MAANARRAVLIVLLLAVPFLLTWLLYRGSLYLLYATNRVIDPKILWYAGIAELLAFFLVGIMEVKDRW
jgi:hypothetical protein